MKDIGGDDLLIQRSGDRGLDGRSGPAGEAHPQAELIGHLNSERTTIYQDWATRIAEEDLVKSIRREELLKDVAALFDHYVASVRNGEVEGLLAYVREMAARYMARGVEAHEIVGTVVMIGEVLDRSLRRRYSAGQAPDGLLDEFARATTRIKLSLVGSILQERERTIHEQEEAIRQLSTPVLRVRDRLLILPIVGPINAGRARQLTEQLLMGIRNYRAKVAVIDITGVPVMDGPVANHLVQAVGAARLLGATVITSGLAPEIAQTLVQIGVDLAGLRTVGDLQGGIEEAERLLGYEVVSGEPASPDTGQVQA